MALEMGNYGGHKPDHARVLSHGTTFTERTSSMTKHLAQAAFVTGLAVSGVLGSLHGLVKEPNPTAGNVVTRVQKDHHDITSAASTPVKAPEAKVELAATAPKSMPQPRKPGGFHM